MMNRLWRHIAGMPDTEMMALVQPLVPALRRYARALLHEPADADDLVQDVLERAMMRWHQRRGDNVRAWLFTILHNLAMDFLRRRGRHGVEAPLDLVPEAQMATAHTQEDVIREADILTQFARLPPDQRSILLLIAVEDLTYGEAAQVLDIPIGTVMSRLSRARERLRRILEAGDKGMDVAPVKPSLRIVP